MLQNIWIVYKKGGEPKAVKTNLEAAVYAKDVLGILDPSSEFSICPTQIDQSDFIAFLVNKAAAEKKDG